MKKLLLSAVVASALVASAWQIGHAQGQVSPFQVRVEVSGTALKAECLKGCKWKTLTYECADAKVPCKAEIDELGVGGSK